MKTTAKLWTGVAILAILSPIGLLLPAKLKAGSAWGEWGTDEMAKLVGYVPAGLQKLSSLWNAAFPDYAFKNGGHPGLAYLFSALLGIGLCVAVTWLLARLLAKKRGDLDRK